MYYVYVLKSDIDKELYIGSTNNLKQRFKEHNTKKVFSTKKRTPLTLIYYEAYKSEPDARMREKRLKQRGQARVHLVSRLTESLGQN